MDNPFESPAVISFCPGILGLERGLARAGCECRVVTYVEIEAFIIANLVAGMEAGLVGAAPIWTDAKTFDARPFRGKIHGIIGGYPCPGESLAGLREGHLYKGFIWPSIRRAIAAARPLWCFFENVDDHLTGTYPIVQRSLFNMGYTVEAGIFSAQEVGAPHQRKRLFILAMENTNVHRFRWYHKKGFLSKVIGTSSELANTESRVGRLSKSSGWDYYSNVERSSKTVANANRKREQVSITRKQPTKQFAKWPAPQGNYQHEWEEPRTVEPGLGCTVDGYNFREDLLRALGNSVVEQTAEIAFRSLLNKFL